MFSIKEFAEFLGEAAVKADESNRRELDRAAKVVQHRAKKIIGHYQVETGPFAPWAPLAASTRAEKARLGFGPPDNPGLRTGGMRESIDRAVEDHEAVVGSNDENLVYFELGTSKQPPRSVLGAAAFQEAHTVAEIMGKGFVARVFPAKHGTWQPPGPMQGSSSAGGFGREFDRLTSRAEAAVAEAVAEEAGAGGLIEDIAIDAVEAIR